MLGEQVEVKDPNNNLGYVIHKSEQFIDILDDWVNSLITDRSISDNLFESIAASRLHLKTEMKVVMREIERGYEWEVNGHG